MKKIFFVSLLLACCYSAFALSITHVGSYDTGGYADEVYVRGNYAFVAAGTNGLQIININDPAHPSLAGSYPVYRAQSVYLSGNYAFVGGGTWNSEFNIINISDPANPSLAGSCDIPGANHNINGIYVSGNYAFVAESGGAGLQIINISDPVHPSLAGSYDLPGAYDVYVSGSYAFVADFNYGLKIINISDPAHPSLAGSYYIDYWCYAEGVYVNGSYAFLACHGNAGGLYIINISDPAHPTVAGLYSDPAWHVYVSGSYAYSAGSGGLHIIDISDPYHPSLAASCGTVYGSDVYVSGSNVFVADGWYGLKIFNMTEDPGTLQFSVSSTSVNENAGSVTLTVTRTNGNSGAASVNYTTANGTASAGTDYTATSGTTNWADGDADSKTITVPISIRYGTQGSRSFTATLSGASGASLGSTYQVTVTINDVEISGGVVPLSVSIHNNAEVNITVAPITVVQDFGFKGFKGGLVVQSVRTDPSSYAVVNISVTAATTSTRASPAIGMLFDSSGSMSSSDPSRLRVAAGKRFVDGMQASDNSAAMDFGAGSSSGFSSTRLLQGFTTDKATLKTAMDRVTASQGTPMYESIVEVANYFAQNSQAQGKSRLVLLFADGAPNGSGTQAAALSALANADIRVMSVGLGEASDNSSSPVQDAVDKMKAISDATDGIYVGLTSADYIETVFGQISDSIYNGQYVISLTLSPTVPAGQSVRITIETNLGTFDVTVVGQGGVSDIEFPINSGYFWNVAASETPMNPGGNYWSGSTNVVWVDSDGQLHLTIKQLNGKWYCSGLTSTQPAQYGTFRFYVDSRLDLLYDNAVLGMFLYRRYSDTDIRELDIEVAKSFVDAARPLWFSVKNKNGNGNVGVTNYPITMSGSYSTHYIRWEEGTAEFRSFHGHYLEPVVGEFGSFISPASAASHMPTNNEPYVNLNFWLDGACPSDTNTTLEVVITDFDYQAWIGPAIKANGAANQITVNYPEKVSVTVEMNADTYEGVPVDWWVVACAENSGEWYYLNSAGQWPAFNGDLAFCRPAYQGGLINLSPTTVLDRYQLPRGTYDFWFAVDYPMDGILDPNGQILFDKVTVVVQ